MKKYEEAAEGRKIVLENKEFADINKHTRKIIELYGVGLNEHADSILAELCRSYNSLGNPAPRRVRIEQAALEFEDFLYERKRKGKTGMLR